VLDRRLYGHLARYRRPAGECTHLYAWPFPREGMCVWAGGRVHTFTPLPRDAASQAD
jgi:hypothetical protein